MGNLHSSEGVHLRFLDGCPEIPPAPAEDQVQILFDELLLSTCADQELREEINTAESIETKWAYAFMSKLPHGSVAEEWLDPRDCVELVQRFRGDVKCVHDLFLAIRINMLLRPSVWVEKFVSENGIEQLMAPLQGSGGASVETCNEVLSTLFVLINSSNGVQGIVDLPDCCPLLYSIFDSSPSNEVKSRSLKLMGMLSRESSMARDGVISAFSSKSPEDRSLQSLVIKIEQNQSDIAFQLAAMKFVNGILETTRNRKQRASICEDLKENGLLALLKKFKNRDVATDANSAILASMAAEVEVFLEVFNEAKKEDTFGALRVALGDALNTNRSDAPLMGSRATGNQGENDGSSNPEPEQASERGSKDSTSDTETGILTESHDSEDQQRNLDRQSIEVPERIETTVQLDIVQSIYVDENSEARSNSDNALLDSVFNQLQQHTKKLDQATNEKLTHLLEKIALTLSNESGACQAFDRLEKVLSSQTSGSEQANSGLHEKESANARTTEAKEPDLLTRVGMALFPSMGESASSVTKPPTSGKPTLFSSFGDFSLPSLTVTTPAKSSISRPSFSSFIGADTAGRPAESSATRGVKLSLPFFQSSRKGPGLGVTPACTPIATASVRKDAKRPVFPSFPSPPRKEPPPVLSPTQASVVAPPPPPTALPSAPSLPPIDMTPELPTANVVVKPLLVIEPDAASDSDALPPPSTGIDISKFRKLLSMGAPREAVRAKMQQAGIDPDLLDEQQGFTPKASPRPMPTVVKMASEAPEPIADGPDVSKFRKLLSMGAPLEAVKAKMRQAGLDPNLLDQNASATPEVKELMPPSAKPTSSPDVSKFKKLLAMGAPIAVVKAKMTQAGLDPELLDGPPCSSSVPAAPSARLKVKNDPNYAKFFKLLSMGAPAAAVKAKMAQAGLNSDFLDTPDADMPTVDAPSESTPPASETSTNPRALLSIMLASRTAPPVEAPMKVKDDPQYAKFFKLLSMGAPPESVKAKMRMANLQPELLDTPDAPLQPVSSPSEVVSSQPEVKVKDDPAYAKFFKLLSMGAPAESVKAKMRMTGLNPDLLDAPDASLPSVNAPAAATKSAVKVKDDPGYAKFFKLLSMGAPAESVKAKMQMAGLRPELLDTPDADLRSGDTQAPAQPQVKVKDDPAYAKFFKLLEMGAPAESVKAKMRMAGLQGDLLDTPDALLPGSAPVNPPATPAPTSTAARRAHLSIAIKPAIKAKTRAFYWQHLKAEAIKGTIWEELEKEHSNQCNQDWLTLTESELELLETEFPPPAACGPSTGSRRGSMSGIGSPGGPASPLASPRIVFLIDRARSNNISIIVKQFKMSNAALRVAIMKMDSEVLTLDRVQGLIKILPTEEEIAAITGFTGDPTTLNGAELVLKELITVPRLKQRLSALETKHQFPALVRDLQTKINKIRVASNEIAQSSEFKTILTVILQVGNKMNHGTARGGAKGFRLNDLTKLVQLKSVDKSVTLLHYVARMIRTKKGNVVRLGDSLASLYDVQSIPIPELLGDMNRINDITENINVELAAQRLKNRIEEKEESDLFVESMTVFVDEAAKDVSTLKTDLDENLRLMRDIMIRFDKSTDDEEAPPQAADAPPTPAALAGAGEFFSIIYEFTMSLMKADRENEIKRIREEKRLKQQELKNATPRRNSVDQAALKKLDSAAGPDMEDSPRRKSMIAVPSNASFKTDGVSSLLAGASSKPISVNVDDAGKAEAKPESSTTPGTANSLKNQEIDVEKLKLESASVSKPTNVAPAAVVHADETQPSRTPNFILSTDEKVLFKPTGIPKPALKVPGKVSTSASVASPLKKVVGSTPTGIPSPLKLKRTNSASSSTEKSKAQPVPFDAASLSEIKSQLKTKRTTNNELRTLKPEVETEGEDHDNNNSEPSSPEKALSEAEPSTREAVQSEA